MLIAVLTLLLLGDERVPAHKMPDLERIQRRLHAGDNELRRLRAEMDDEIGGGRTGIVVIGKHTPELLMRWELMNHVEGAFSSEVHFAKYTPRWQKRGAAKLLGENYLERLQNVMAPLVNAQKELARLQAGMKALQGDELAAAQKEHSRVMKSVCPLRARAMADGQKEFGAEAFDRFLYEAVAADAIITTSPMTPEDMLDMVQWLDEGCP